MLTGLELSSLAYHCVFYRPEHNAKGDHIELNFECLEMQKRKISTDRSQLVDEKNVVICLAIMLTVIRMSKVAHFFLLSAEDSKKPVTIWVKHLSASERSYLALLENAMDYRILGYH